MDPISNILTKFLIDVDEHEETNEDEANLSVDEDTEELLVINKIESLPVI